MAVKRILVIGSASIVASLAIATAAQAAYTATATLYGTDVKVLSVLECKAVATSSQSDDRGATTEAEGYPCSSVSVKVFYQNSSGYYGWSSTDTDLKKAVVVLSGSNQLQNTYNTATR